MSQGIVWGMLKDQLSEKLEGYKVSHALFTTYAFEPEFFETVVLPMLTTNQGESLSLHSAVRRLQMEAILRESPIGIDVYFDARVVLPGCPWLPYSMIPVRSSGEFHGKVILLLLENEDGDRRCILGSGSANLTRAGWWENLEVWNFTDPFNPATPPGGLSDGVRNLLGYLMNVSGRSVRATATEALVKTFKNAAPKPAKPGEPRFGVFLPGGEEKFLDWIDVQTKKYQPSEMLEVISPYFAEADQKALVASVLEATRAKLLHLWLPLDPWQAGGPAVLMEEEQYDELSKVKSLRWCSFSEKSLKGSREGSVPRFLHAKVFRSPGSFCFVGSVNFSHKAFNRNFEAGFLFPDTQSAPWLVRYNVTPERFLKPPTITCHAQEEESLPLVEAVFNWQTSELTLAFTVGSKTPFWMDRVVSVLDAAGNPTGFSFRVPSDGKMNLKILPNQAVYLSLQTNPWLSVKADDGAHQVVVWVRQEELAFRPPPADITPDLWRILDLWRGLGLGKMGSHPGDFSALEIMLSRRSDAGEAPPTEAPVEDLFARMAIAHGAFYALRKMLDRMKDSGENARVSYYFSAPRPDTITSLLSKLKEEMAPGKGDESDAIERWVILKWVQQIAMDHNIDEARKTSRKVAALLGQLENSPPLSKVNRSWLKWAGEIFLCGAGKESGVTRRMKNAGRGA